ncbi:MAG: ABC transporter permease [Eubacterium sp.]|jgi:ABC-2 type transport system permease protein|nr:ABC transporter permease [Eubacterium sp.]NBI85156.1 ABC transporter permease [Lachnospiraceae bacterium]
MKQFWTILKFELQSYLKNKIFVGITVLLVGLIAVVMFFPSIMGNGSDINEGDEAAGVEGLMLFSAEGLDDAKLYQTFFEEAFTEYEVGATEDDEERIKERVVSGEAECAFVLHSPTSYTYYVDNLSIYDSRTAIADTVLENVYQINAMAEGGMSPEQVNEALSVKIEGETQNLGKDQMQNFFYTYIMIFALYLVILLYGQMVATNVATEKSSRAMELLITSAKPVSMMFGKVLSSCLAGFFQIVAVFGAAILFYNLNKAQWGNNFIIASLFDMPISLLVYMLIFFVLGFLMYAFMFGAIGSTASKLEDINTSVMPVVLLFVAGFIVVMTSMSGGDVDSLLMQICSYVPFTSPMAMFTRIAMSTVPLYQIAISIAVLIVSVVAVGVLSAKIYRVGVLLYGTKPKLGGIFKAMKKS